MRSLRWALLAALALGATTARGSVLFDFNSGPLHASLPLDLTVGGITAHLSATGQGFSIQDPNTTILFTPTGFSGYCLSPNSVFASDLQVDFGSTTLSDFSILVAPQELNTNSTATMRVTGYLNGAFVATSTEMGTEPFFWPSGTLSLHSAQGFNSVVVHYDSPPPTGGDYGPIFVADNMDVTPVPEPATAGLLAVSLATLAAARRRKT